MNFRPIVCNKACPYNVRFNKNRGINSNSIYKKT